MEKVTLMELEDQIRDSLGDVQAQDIGSKERAAATKETCDLLDRFIEAERLQCEYWDKEDRRDIERERNEQMLKIEQEKNCISKPRMILEIAKIVVPVVVPMLAYGVYQKRVLEFEENGRITSTAGRELHLPKFFK